MKGACSPTKLVPMALHKKERFRLPQETGKKNSEVLFLIFPISV
jgi:hypothetical protein